jgi:hypothetical protein
LVRLTDAGAAKLQEAARRGSGPRNACGRRCHRRLPTRRGW